MSFYDTVKLLCVTLDSGLTMDGTSLEFYTTAASTCMMHHIQMTDNARYRGGYSDS